MIKIGRIIHLHCKKNNAKTCSAWALLGVAAGILKVAYAPSQFCFKLYILCLFTHSLYSIFSGCIYLCVIKNGYCMYDRKFMLSVWSPILFFKNVLKRV